MNCLVYIVAGTQEEADKIIEHLLSKHLVACVNYFPISSKFWWEGKLDEADEVAMIAKSRMELRDEIIKEVRAVHSYDVPAIDFIPITESYPELDQWLAAETGK